MVHLGQKNYQKISGYDCRKRCVLSLRRKSDSQEAAVMLSGRLFQSLGPAAPTSSLYFDGDKTRRADHELTGGRRAETPSRRNINNATQRVEEI